MGVNEKLTRDLAKAGTTVNLINRNNRVITILEGKDSNLKISDAIQILRGTNNLLRELKC